MILPIPIKQKYLPRQLTSKLEYSKGDPSINNYAAQKYGFPKG